VTNASPLEVRAEWPGRVAEVHVTAGQEVAAGDALVTLEAMKMLTPVPAPRAGTVDALLVAVDAIVEQGAVLARLR
jgi:biotin carboxyl carrier protein